MKGIKSLFTNPARMAPLLTALAAVLTAGAAVAIEPNNEQLIALLGAFGGVVVAIREYQIGRRQWETTVAVTESAPARPKGK